MYDKKSFTHIRDVLKKLMLSYRSTSDSEMVRIWEIWDNVLGAPISSNAQPAAFKGKTLIVHVVSSPWIQQLQFLQKDIIKKVNTAAGMEMVQEIKFKIGSF